MFYTQFILFTFFKYIIFTQLVSVVQPQKLQSGFQHPFETSKIPEKNLDYEQHEDGLIDPHDMFPGLSTEQLKELLDVKNPVIETSTNPTVDNKLSVNNKDDATAHTDKSKVEVSVSSIGETLYPLKDQKVSCAPDSAYVTRWVKKLLHRIEKESDMESSDITFSLDSTVMESLKKMANAKLFEISDVDNIISNLLAQAIIKRKESFMWSNIYVYYSGTLMIPGHWTGTVTILFILLAIIISNYIFFTSWFDRIHPQHIGSQVEDVSPSRRISTEDGNAAFTIQNESDEEILAEDSTGLPKAQSPAERIQYNSGDDATKLPNDSQRIASKVDYEPAEPISRYSDPVVDVNVKKSPEKSILAIEISPKRSSIGDNSKVYNADSIGTTRDASSSKALQLISNNSRINLDEVEVSNLPESLSDSFEVLPTDDDIYESNYCNKGLAGPNCESSLDILQEMQCSCKFCK